MIKTKNIFLDKDGIDDATDAYILADRMTRHAWHLDGIKELRHAYRSEVDYKGNLLPGARHIASIPWYVMTGLMGRYGAELLDDHAKLFFKWLDKHPEYKVGR